MFATSTTSATVLLREVSCRARTDAWRRSAQGRVERAGLVGRPEGLPVSGAQRAPWRELAHDVGSAIGEAVALPGRHVGGACRARRLPGDATLVPCHSEELDDQGVTPPARLEPGLHEEQR